MGVAEKVSDLIAPIVAANDATLYDVTLVKEKLQVLVSRPDGLDLDVLADITRAVSRLLDEHDLIQSAYTLEVSSPGLERTLRTSAHFQGAVTELVNIKTKPTDDGDRRVRGVLVAADDAVCRIELDDGSVREIDHDQIERARTVFEWGPPPKPARAKNPKSSKAKNKGGAAKDEASTKQSAQDRPQGEQSPTEKNPTKQNKVRSS